MPSFNLNPEHLMQDVYSYPFPEVRQLLRTTDIDPDFMINTLLVDEASVLLEGFGFQPALELPARVDGTLDLDELHTPVIERIRQHLEPVMPGLATYANAYPTHGSSQAMFNLMAEWHATGSMTSLAVLAGEYDGYRAYADSLHIPVQEYDAFDEAPVTDGQVWFLSNPSALDGNWHDKDQLETFIAAGHEIVLDAAYVGLTTDGSLDVSAPNIRALLTSPSKIFGVFRYRNTGVTYTREPVACMYGTKWFKDVPALLETLKLYESFGPHELPQRYKAVQAFLCRQLVKVVETDITPSDVLLLAHTDGPVAPTFEPFRRGARYRFGLTKLFEDYERVQ